MQKILESISALAIQFNPAGYSKKEQKEKWIGRKPATDADVEKLEKRLGVKLPKDVVQFYEITNGSSDMLHNHFSAFLPVSKVDFLNKLDPELIDAYAENKELLVDLERAIVIAGLGQDLQILLIPPNSKSKKWRYWEFAHYIPGESEFSKLESYLERVEEFLSEQIKLPAEHKSEVDYSLRDAVYNQDWEDVFVIAQKFIDNKVIFLNYGDFYQWLRLILLASKKLNRQAELKAYLEKTIVANKDDASYCSAAADCMAAIEVKSAFIIGDEDLEKFKPQENPKGLVEIEAQIKEHRKDLMNPKNALEKSNYQEYFLFLFGNAKAYKQLLESETCTTPSFLNAARVYAYLGENEKAKMYIQKYVDDEASVGRVPLKHFLHESLFRVIEK
jgi:hypothetical protein